MDPDGSCRLADERTLSSSFLFEKCSISVGEGSQFVRITIFWRIYPGAFGVASARQRS